MNNTLPKTIILIPAYEPGEALLATTSRLIAEDFIVVVVDDGSGAEYRPMFNRLDTRVRLVRHDVNKGKGAALKTGYRYIRDTFDYFIVVTADADGQHNVDDIKRVAAAYLTHPGTLMLGARTFAARDVPLRSKFGNELTKKVFSLITKKPLGDTQTGLRAFDASLIGFMIDVPGERFEYEMNVLLACSRAGIELVELPIQTIYENGNQSSHFNPIKDSIAIYGQVIRFASVSLLSFALDYLLFILLVHLTGSWGLATSVLFANITARVVSASFNFGMNRRVVFRHNGSVTKSALQYALLAGGILLANTLLLTVLTSALGIAPYIAKIITELICFIVSYLVQKHLIFARKKEARA